MERIFGKPLITQKAIEKRIRELGAKITADYEGKDLLMICLLKGAYTFFADLVRNIQLPVMVDFMMVSSYGERSASSGSISIIQELSSSIEGKDVLLVEDIIDSGLTLEYIYETLQAKRPNSLKLCVLLDKAERRKHEVPMEYIGFTVPNKFIIGYGLDYQDKYRNLPYIAILDKSD
ncbi:MAG: hypoxanthine phosphoribosyltransferase [Nitrospirae bacterium RBG_16_43_11]|nr:MAG: hypoxanthine phosphoribosyltransferase [Nitrospirae bacterium RBG_16_43_11]